MGKKPDLVEPSRPMDISKPKTINNRFLHPAVQSESFSSGNYLVDSLGS